MVFVLHFEQDLTLILLVFTIFETQWFHIKWGEKNPIILLSECIMIVNPYSYLTANINFNFRFMYQFIIPSAYIRVVSYASTLEFILKL